MNQKKLSAFHLISSATASSPTLEEWLQEWFDTYKVCTVKASTAKRYQQIIRLITSCEESRLPITLCDTKSLMRILITLQGRSHQQGDCYSKSSLKKVKEVLTQSLKKAKHEKLIEGCPWAELTLPMAPEKKILPLSHWQQDLVERACEKDPQGHLVLFLLLTGIRRSELINLTWKDFDAAAGTILIRKSKTPAGVRVVYLLSAAQRIIESQPKLGTSIFYNTKGSPISESSLRRLCERIRKATMIDTFTCHVCRHTFVTRLCEKGASAKAIAQIIGHASTEYVLDIYALLEQEELRKTIYVMEEPEACQSRAII